MKKLKLLEKLKNTDEKNKIILKHSLLALLIKGGALLISVFSMPAYISYFDNKAVLGVWYTMLSVLTWIITFDFGIGNGLRNSLVKYLETGDKAGAKSSVSSAYISIGVVSGAILLVFCVIAPFISWNGVFNISSELVGAKAMTISVAVAFAGLIGQFFLKTTNSILYAIQKSSINNLISLFQSLGMLVFVLTFPTGNGTEYNLIALSIAFALINNIPLAVATFVIFFGSLRFAAPSIKFCKKPYVKEIMQIGGLFLLCQIMYLLIMNTNEFIITTFVSPDAVVDYQIYYKIFSLTGTVFMLALTPVWSAITKAQQQADFLWLKKSFKVLNAVSLVGMLAQFLIIPLIPFIIKIWLGDEAIAVNYLYCVVFAFFGGAFVYQSALSTMVCGLGRMKLQAISYAAGFVLRILLVYLGIKFIGEWIVVVAANAVVFIPYIILEIIFTNNYLKRRIAAAEASAPENDVEIISEDNISNIEKETQDGNV